MTTSGVNSGSGPLNVLVVLDQQQQPRGGSGQNPDLDFAGLLSRLSATVDAGGINKAEQPQPFAAKVGIDTTPATQRTELDPSVARVPDTHRTPDPTDGQIVQISSEEADVITSDASVDEKGVCADAETLAPADGASSEGGAILTLVKAHGQPEEIQALLSSVLRSAPLDAGRSLPQTPGKASAQAAAVQSGRSKAGDGAAESVSRVAGDTQSTGAQLPVDSAWQEPVQVSLNHVADSMTPRGKDDGVSASAAAPDLKLAVLQTETHHAPVLHGGPMAQVAEGIRSELGDAGETALTWSPAASAAAKPHADAPIKVLLIQLQPADLGTVTVRMSLKDDALELQIEASQQDTAQRLQQDQDSLSKVLRTAGYLIDGVAIRAADPDRSLVLQSQTSASLSQSPHQQTAGGAPSEGGASHGRGQHEHTARGQARQDTPADANGQRQAPSSGLFV